MQATYLDDPDSLSPRPSRSRHPSSSSMALFTIRSEQGFPTRAVAKRRRRMRLLASYTPDWLLTIILAAVFFSLDSVHGFRREFSIDDETIHFPFATKERVPPFALYIIAVVAPFIIQIALNLLTIRSFWDFHNGTLGLLLSLVLAGSITQFTKITVGRPRPDLISRCDPPPGITNPGYGLVTDAICRQADESILRDGWRSFPSGHSSLSFAGLAFLAFYTAGKLHLFDEKGHTSKAWISAAPLAGAALVAISRTMDYRHHWQDVLVGSILGLTTAFFSYRQYYPPLTSAQSHMPYAPRIPRDPLIDGDDDGSSGPILPTTGAHTRTDSAAGDGRGGLGVTHPVNPHLHFNHGHTHSTSPQEGYKDDLNADEHYGARERQVDAAIELERS